MDEKIRELKSLDKRGMLPPLSKEIPLNSETIFYKKEPEFLIKTKSLKFQALLMLLCLPVLGCCFYIIKSDPETSFKTHLPFVGFLLLVIVIWMGFNILKRKRQPQTAEIFNSGIWFSDYKIFVPYERIYSTDLIYQGKKKSARTPYIHVFMADKERDFYIKKLFLLRLINFKKEENLLKIDFGVTETFINPDADTAIESIYLLAERQNEKSGIKPPYYIVDPELGWMRQLINSLSF